MGFLKRNFFYFPPFLLFFSCGENFFGVDNEKNLKPLKEILADPRNDKFVNRLMEAFNKSPQSDFYYEKLLSRFGPEFYEKFSKGFENKKDMFSSLDKIPLMGKKVEDLLQKKYEAAKKNRGNGPEAEKAYKQAVLYSVSSKLKRNFYTEDNKFSIETAGEKLTETEAQEIVKEMQEYNSISNQKLFAGIDDSSEESSKRKLFDFFNKPENQPPSASG